MKFIRSLILICVTNYVTGQNQFRNSSFEIVPNQIFPTAQAQVQTLDGWEADMTDFPCFVNLQATTFFMHSPDWFVSNAFYKLFTQTGHINVAAHTGQSYVGMAEAELIEQSLLNNLQHGQEYELSTYFQFPGNCDTWTTDPVTLNGAIDEFNKAIIPSSEIHLKVFMAENKILYSNIGVPSCADITSSNGAAFADWENNPSNNCDHSDGLAHHHTVIADWPLNTNDYSVGLWHKLTTRFTVPNDNNNYSWIGFEVQCGNDTYIIIDDVRLIRTCEMGCTNISNGVPDPHFEEYPDGGPKAMGARFTNLQNIETIKIDVTYMNGNHVRTQQFTNNNGFSGPVYWDGLTDAAQPVASGNYIITLTCTNACGPFTFTQVVNNPGCANYPPETNPPYSVIGADQQTNDCCELVKTLNNRSFGMGPIFSPNLWHYRPRNEIDMNNCVIQSICVDMELIAGQVIAITETTIEPNGHEFRAYIEPCADANRMMSNYFQVVPDYGVNSQPSANVFEKNTNTDITVFPNPSNDGRFELSTSKDANALKISVYSSTGVLVKEIGHSKSIDISSFNKGLYLVEIYDGITKTIKKIVYL